MYGYFLFFIVGIGGLLIELFDEVRLVKVIFFNVFGIKCVLGGFFFLCEGILWEYMMVVILILWGCVSFGVDCLV